MIKDEMRERLRERAKLESPVTGIDRQTLDQMKRYRDYPYDVTLDCELPERAEPQLPPPAPPRVTKKKLVGVLKICLNILFYLWLALLILAVLWLLPIPR